MTFPLGNFAIFQLHFSMNSIFFNSKIDMAECAYMRHIFVEEVFT